MTPSRCVQSRTAACGPASKRSSAGWSIISAASRRGGARARARRHRRRCARAAALLSRPQKSPFEAFGQHVRRVVGKRRSAGAHQRGAAAIRASPARSRRCAKKTPTSARKADPMTNPVERSRNQSTSRPPSLEGGAFCFGARGALERGPPGGGRRRRKSSSQSLDRVSSETDAHRRRRLRHFRRCDPVCDGSRLRKITSALREFAEDGGLRRRALKSRLMCAASDGGVWREGPVGC